MELRAFKNGKTASKLAWEDQVFVKIALKAQNSPWEP